MPWMIWRWLFTGLPTAGLFTFFGLSQIPGQALPSCPSFCPPQRTSSCTWHPRANPQSKVYFANCQLAYPSLVFLVLLRPFGKHFKYIIGSIKQYTSTLICSSLNHIYKIYHKVLFTTFASLKFFCRNRVPCAAYPLIDPKMPQIDPKMPQIDP